MTRHAWGADLDDDREYADPDPRRHDVPELCTERWGDEIGCDDGNQQHQCMYEAGHPSPKHPCQCGAFVLEDSPTRRADIDFSRTLAALDGVAGDSIYARAEMDGCCALEPGHEGPCAHVCPECRGSQKCWACNGHDPGDDLGSGCTECDGWGHCTYCYEGMVDDA